MKILKWFKRESGDGFSTIEPKNVQMNGRKKKLTRNESYLNALSKFAKWRQVHLSSSHAGYQSTNKHMRRNVNRYRLRTSTSTTTNSEANLLSNNISYHPGIYEEVEQEAPQKSSMSEKVLDCLVSNECKGIAGKEASIEERYCNSIMERLNDLEYTVKEYSDLNKLIESPAVDEEPEYALPYEFEKKYSETETYSKVNLMVTDLDKSQDSILFNKEEQKFANIKENYIELLKCPLKNIKMLNSQNHCKIMNGHLENAENDGMEISLLQMNENRTKGLKWNLETLRKLRHPNILLLMGICCNSESEPEALVLEPVQCSLYEEIHISEDRIPINVCQKYTLQLSNAVLYLHKQHILHTNICSKNILLCGYDKEKMTVKLAGFELVMNLEDANSLPDRENWTEHFYEAPEYFNNSESMVSPSYTTDVYGICITLWEMLNCVIPYAQFSRHELKKVFTLKNAQLPIYEKSRHAPFQYLLEQGLQTVPDDRCKNVASLKQALQEIEINSKPILVHNYTLKKRKETEFFDFVLSSENDQDISPAKRAVTEDMQRKSMNLKDSRQPLKNAKSNNSTPNNKKYNVNILINSKCSPHCPGSAPPRHSMGPTALAFDECDAFEFASNLSLPSEDMYPSNPFGLQSRPCQATEIMLPQVMTEDFFIDDDF